MPHMMPDIGHFSVYQVETTCGTECVPVDVVGRASNLQYYVEGKLLDVEPELVTGWFARLSAPGYLDCTEWSGPYSTEQEARDYITDQFDVDADTGEDLEG